MLPAINPAQIEVEITFLSVLRVFFFFTGQYVACEKYFIQFISIPLDSTPGSYFRLSRKPVPGLFLGLPRSPSQR